MFLPRPDDESIIKTFLTDLNNKMPNVCGRKMRFSTQPNYMSSGLMRGEQVSGRIGSMITKLRKLFKKHLVKSLNPDTLFSGQLVRPAHIL